MTRVERIKTLEALAPLEEPWKRLAESIPNLPVFLTWEWVNTWVCVFREDRTLCVLTVYDAQDELLGIAPFVIENRSVGPLTARHMRFIGGGVVASDHLDVLARPGFDRQVCAACIEYLQGCKGEWDVLVLEGLASDSVLRDVLASSEGTYRERQPISCPYVTLPEDWRTFELTVLSANRRQQLRRRLRQLNGDYDDNVQFRQMKRLEHLPEAFDRLVSLNRARWVDKPGSTSFDREKFVEFHRRISMQALERGWLRLYELVVDGEVIATQYSFAYKGIYYDYQKGFDPEWSRYSPGQLMLAHLIKEAIEDGAWKLDLLRGDEDYKTSWTSNDTTDTHALFALRGRGKMWMTAVAALDVAKLIGRRALPGFIQDKLVEIAT